MFPDEPEVAKGQAAYVRFPGFEYLALRQAHVRPDAHRFQQALSAKLRTMSPVTYGSCQNIGLKTRRQYCQLIPGNSRSSPSNGVRVTTARTVVQEGREFRDASMKIGKPVVQRRAGEAAPTFTQAIVRWRVIKSKSGC